jgi:polyhydroxyalkanoate synthesis regulator phasin
MINYEQIKEKLTETAKTLAKTEEMTLERYKALMDQIHQDFEAHINQWRNNCARVMHELSDKSFFDKESKPTDKEVNNG